MEIAYQSNALLGLFLARLLGKEDCNTATENEKNLLRLLTPIAKLYTAKNAIKYASEHIETFGGIGYLEDSGIPVMLRDTQTLSIWEGTTNVLSLDMLRSIEKENGLQAFTWYAETTLSTITAVELQQQVAAIQQKKDALFRFVGTLSKPENMVAASRDVAFYIAELSIALLWLDFVHRNPENKKYLHTLQYCLHYTMNEKNFESADYLLFAE